jgi:autotransporter-associated beta strand protein
LNTIKLNRRRYKQTESQVKIIALAVAAMACPVAWGQTYYYDDTSDQGLWSAAANWSPSGPPTSNATVILGQKPASVANLNCTYNLTNGSYGSVTLNSSSLSGSMIVNQTGSSTVLNANYLYVGTTTPDNVYNQSAGTNSSGVVELGVNSGGNYYNLSGTAVLDPVLMDVGVAGTGIVNQTGSSIFGGTGLTLGDNATGNGTYTLTAGTFGNTTIENVTVGYSGTGVFQQNGGTATIENSGSATLLIGYDAGSTGTYNLSAGSLSVDTIALGNNGTGTMNVSGSGVLSAGSVYVGVNGTGRLNLSAVSQALGSIFVGGGTVGGTGTGVVNLSGTDSVASTNIYLAAGGTFNLLSGGSLGAEIIMSAGQFEMEGGTFSSPPGVQLNGGTFYLNGYSVNFGYLTGTGGAIQTSGSGTTILTISGNSLGSLGGYSGEITDGTGTLGLTITGNGTLEELSGIGTYSGPTTINSGATLEAGGAFAISPSSAVTLNGGTLNLNGFNTTIPSLSGTGGTVAVTAATLSLGGTGTGYSSTYGGAFTGTGSVIKTGSGTVTLAGTASGTFNGTFNVSGGTLANGAINGIPTASTVSLGIGAALQVNYNQTLAEVYGSLSTLNFSNGSILTVGGDNGSSSFAGYLLGSGTFTKAGTGTFTLGSGVNDSFPSNIDTTLNFNVAGGTLVLNRADGTNAIDGSLNINGGTVLYAQGDQIGDTSTVTINSGTYNLAGKNDTIGGLAGTGGTVLFGGGNLTVNQSAGTTCAAVLTGVGTFSKSGPGLLTLSNASGFAGSFNANGGLLILAGPVNATGLTANSGGTLEFQGSTLTLNSGVIQANSGGAVDYSNCTIKNGYLIGAGADTILNNGSTSFFDISTFNSLVLNQNGPAVFSVFTNGGTLNNNASLTLSEGVISSSGIFNVNSSVSSVDFSSDGIININTSGGITNTVGNLILGGGSRTYVNPGGTLSTATGTTIELNGALLKNSGTVSGVVDVNFGSLATGLGTYGSTVNVNPGGTYAPGLYGAATVPPNTSSTIALIQPAASGVNTNTSSPVAVTADAIITVNGTDTLTLTGGLNAIGYSVLKTGTGTVQVAPFSAASLDVSAGKVQLLASHPIGVLEVTSLAVGSGATLDIGNNAADIASGNLAAITALASTGYSRGSWAGAGITSSSAAADSTHLTAVGVIQNNQSGTAIYTVGNQFEGTTPGVGDVLVKYTYYGDTNLDGRVNSSDYTRVDNGYLSHLTGWFNGDFNYDGIINGSDYTLIDNAFNQQGAVLSTQIAGPTAEVAGANTTVPEPAGVMWLFAGLGFLSRRATLVARRQ